MAHRPLPENFDPQSPAPALARRPSDRRWDWWIPLAALILTMLVALVSGYRSYANDTDQSTLRQKIAVLEQQQKESDRRIWDTEQWRIRMEDKVDRILDRVQKP
jgi:hypothetical protein